eukprot:SAG11_NODE_20313_length_448_cov_0.885387_1_plen_63_part_10
MVERLYRSSERPASIEPRAKPAVPSSTADDAAVAATLAAEVRQESEAADQNAAQLFALAGQRR